jgi:hypothetical protein
MSLPLWMANLAGTLRSTFYIGPKTAPATLSAASLTAARTHALPDASGTLALVGSATGGHALVDESGDFVGDENYSVVHGVDG